MPNTNRVWRESGVTAAKWARCHIKAISERADDPVWLRGCLIFPDNMPVSEAKALFTKFQTLVFGQLQIKTKQHLKRLEIVVQYLSHSQLGDRVVQMC